MRRVPLAPPVFHADEEHVEPVTRINASLTWHQ